MNRMRPDRSGGADVHTDERRGRLVGMRLPILTIAAVLMLSACGGGSETDAGTDTETGGDSVRDDQRRHGTQDAPPAKLDEGHPYRSGGGAVSQS